MSDLAELEDDFNHANHRRYGRGLGISPQFERAKAAREPKPQQAAVPAKPKEAPACVPAVAPLPEVTDYNSLILCMRQRADQLGLSRETISAVANLPDG
jgi:hypothetical protein